MAEKKSTSSNPFEGKEVIIGALVRRWFKPFMENKILDGLRRTNEPAWMAAAWMYKKKPPTVTIFTGALLAGLTGAEKGLEWLGERTGLFGQLFNIAGQQTLEDVEGTVREYFERQPDEIFVGYNGPKDSDLISLGKIGNLHIKQSISNFFARLPMLLVFNKDGVFKGPGWDLAMSMLMADDETFDNFRSWYKAADKQLKDRAKRVLPTINNSGEFNLFASKTHEQMTDQINIAYEFTRTTLVTDEELEDAMEIYSKVVREPAAKAAADLRKETRAREAELVGKYADSTPPYYQGGLYIPMALFAVIVGGGSLWVSLVAMQNPGTQTSYGLPSGLAKWIPGVPTMTPVEASPNMWGYTIGFVGAVIAAVLITIRVRNNRRAN